MESIKPKYLEKINSPNDLKGLKLSELPDYCAELRQFIITSVAENPGHLGSSLGAVELAVAIHYVFDTPNDKLIWDVGHQAYAHKIITGRRETFESNRKFGGLSGFPKMAESEYDAFGVGHASTSISAAVGIAQGFKLQGKDGKVVAVIGDGSMSGGLAYEGMNNTNDTDLLIILNDNHISIDPNVGAMKEYLLKISTSRRYNNFKDKLWHTLRHTPRFKRFLQKVGDSTKAFFLHQGNYFESMGFRYFGPIDGNDVVSLVKRLEDLKAIKGPKLLHTLTIKGKGYEPAERDQTAWHAPGLFNATTGEKPCGSGKLRYQDVFGHTLVELAKKNDKIVGITPAMPTGCSMNIMMDQMPERAFDVGIAEGHAATFASGLAAAGMVPFCNIYSSFAQRAVDNIVHDTAIQKLEVVYCFDRAGLVGEDGATHHGVFDIAMLRSVPNMIISAPSDAKELRNLMFTAQAGGYEAGFVIRYPRGGSFDADVLNAPFEKLEIGKGRIVRRGVGKIAIIGVGGVTRAALEAAEILASQYKIDVTVVDLRFVKPLDKELLLELASHNETIFTVENGVRDGGAGSAIMEFYADHGIDVKVIRLGIKDEFIEQGSVQQLHNLCGIDADGIVKSVVETL